jgi:hypothetical protein
VKQLGQNMFHNIDEVDMNRKKIIIINLIFGLILIIGTGLSLDQQNILSSKGIMNVIKEADKNAFNQKQYPIFI